MDRIVSVETNLFSSSVIFDDGSCLKLRKKDIAQFKLEAGTETNKEDLVQKLSAFQFADAYEAALDILDRSAKTRREIKTKLSLKGYLNDVAEAVCDRLVEARLIDDGYITERVVQNMAASGKGKYAVMQKLRARGIDKDDAKTALDAIPDEMQNESALNQANKLMRKYASLEKRVRRQKLSQALARRGYSWDSIEYALEKLGDDD